MNCESYKLKHYSCHVTRDLSLQINYASEQIYIPIVLIFPGLPQLDYVLTPRYKATQLCVDRLREKTDAFYDITVAYSDTKDPQTGERIEAPGLPGMTIPYTSFSPLGTTDSVTT